MMLSVCAVVVTYNRKELLIRNLDSLLLQTYPLDILVYDNSSTDGTFEMLSNKGFINNPKFHYVCGDRNTGGAGGFRFGAEKAFEMGFNYLWLMDDDGYCLKDNTLELLINRVKEYPEKAIINSYVTYDVNSLEPTFDLEGLEERKEIERYSVEGKCRGGFPYNATLIPRECFDEIGFNDDRYFIYGDENDYYLRSKEVGYNWITILDSLYYHPINRNIIKEFKLFGSRADVKIQPVWKFFLEMRNTEVNAIKHNGKSRHSLTGYVKVLLIASASRDKRMQRIKYGVLGIHDAKKDFFDRPLMFNI